MKKVSFGMPDEMHERLKNEAQDADVSMAEVCREAVRQKLMNDRVPSTTQIEAELTFEYENEAAHSAEKWEAPKPWYERYAREIERFHGGGEPPARTSPTRQAGEGHRDPREQWD